MFWIFLWILLTVSTSHRNVCNLKYLIHKADLRKCFNLFSLILIENGEFSALFLYNCIETIQKSQLTANLISNFIKNLVHVLFCRNKINTNSSKYFLSYLSTLRIICPPAHCII